MRSARISSIGVAFSSAALLSVPATGFSHHSRANFRFDTVLELTGIVTSHEYQNPHTFLTLEMTTEAGEVQEWLLAANSVSNLRRGGWDADTFAIGESVVVRGNPDRDANKHLMYVDVVMKSDGFVYRSGGLAPGGQDEASNDSSSGSTDFSGVWQPDFSARNIASGFMAADLPMTEKGQSFLNAYDPADDPALNCEAESLPMTLLPIYPVEFSRFGNDEIRLWYEQFDGRRVVHLGLDQHPADTVPTPMGYSIGNIDGNVLTVDTAYFTEDHWGLGRGAPSGLQKHVIERYTLSDDGMRLDVEYTFEDPEFLSRPVTETGFMLLNPGYVMEAWDCDPESARRHLSLD